MWRVSLNEAMTKQFVEKHKMATYFKHTEQLKRNQIFEPNNYSSLSAQRLITLIKRKTNCKIANPM